MYAEFRTDVSETGREPSVQWNDDLIRVLPPIPLRPWHAGCNALHHAKGRGRIGRCGGVHQSTRKCNRQRLVVGHQWPGPTSLAAHPGLFDLSTGGIGPAARYGRNSRTRVRLVFNHRHAVWHALRSGDFVPYAKCWRLDTIGLLQRFGDLGLAAEFLWFVDLVAAIALWWPLDHGYRSLVGSRTYAFGLWLDRGSDIPRCAFRWRACRSTDVDKPSRVQAQAKLCRSRGWPGA